MTDEGGRAPSATDPSAAPQENDTLRDRTVSGAHTAAAVGRGHLAISSDDASPGPATGQEQTPPPRRRLRRALGAGALLLVLALLVGAAVLARHLWLTADAWESRADLYVDEAREIGTELAATRGDLEGTRSELQAVRAQLATAQARIVELADEKAQLGDDREVQRQLVDYQERVSEAGGRVALALDQCVQGQQQLIGYLEAQVTGSAAYDPQELTAFREDVEALCQAASEANISLQRELSR